MTVSDLIQVDKNGNVVGGGKPERRIANKAGFVIHSAIHQARPVCPMNFSACSDLFISTDLQHFPISQDAVASMLNFSFILGADFSSYHDFLYSHSLSCTHPL